MDWIIVVITLALLIILLLVKRSDQIAESAAAEHLKDGALVIDVRSAVEFSSGHLRGAINMPLPQIETLVARQVTDKDQVLLLHCQSGARSGVARRKLASMGYTHVYNIGSYDRAARIAGSQ